MRYDLPRKKSSVAWIINTYAISKLSILYTHTFIQYTERGGILKVKGRSRIMFGDRVATPAVCPGPR